MGTRRQIMSRHCAMVILLWFALVFGCRISASEGQTIECKRTICSKRMEEALDCPGALILVVNVSTSSGQQDDAMLSTLKRFCMGRTSCDLVDACNNRRDEMPRVVNFLCVNNDKFEDNTCTGHVVEMKGEHGFLQSPGYPAATSYRQCHWRIQPQPSAAVHLVLHDLDYQQRSSHVCDGGLHVKAYTCEYPRKLYSRLLCANESERGEGVRVVSCGAVEVQLRSARYTYPLRFWISYTVKDSVVVEPLLRSLAVSGLVGQCPLLPSGRAVVGVPSATTSAAVDAMTPASGAANGTREGRADDDRYSTLTVLIVLVCVVGSIAATLSVVLVVVCIRRRRPKVELIEHVYALPSSCEPLSHNRLSDQHPPPRAVTPPLPRPRLIEQYSDVVDAVPPGRRVTPASPGYAEVECDDSGNDDTKRKRFMFRQQKQPSVSSTTSNSTTYEDVNPLPQTAALNGAVQNSDTAAPQKMAVVNPLVHAATGAVHSTGMHKGVNSDVRGTPVYVRVEQTPAQNSNSNSNKQQISKEKDKDSSNNAKIAPRAAKYTANVTAKATDNKPDDKRGKSGVHSPRLYPLQEGRVASLVSTLDRGQLKKNTKTSTVLSDRNTMS